MEKYLHLQNPEAVVSPGGVGFDINCGVRLLRTNLTEKDVAPVKEKLAQSLFDHIPVGVGSKVELNKFYMDRRFSSPNIVKTMYTNVKIVKHYQGHHPHGGQGPGRGAGDGHGLVTEGGVRLGRGQG